MKHHPPPHSPRHTSPPCSLRLGRRALRFLQAGHGVILLALCDFAARLHGGDPEALLYIGEFIRSASVAFVLLWGAGLGLDLWDKRK